MPLRVSSSAARDLDIFKVSAEVSPFRASSSPTSACERASLHCASTFAEFACWLRIELSSWISRCCNSASAEASCSSASLANCSTSALLNSRMIVSALTGEPA